MPKEINYLSSEELKKSWLNFIAKLENIENDLMSFIYSSLNFYTEVENYHKLIGKELHTDNFIKCCLKLLEWRSTTLNFNQAKQLKGFLNSIARYPLYILFNKLPEYRKHDFILNPGNFNENPVKRRHSKTNELQVWFHIAISFSCELGDRIQINKEDKKKLDQFEPENDPTLPKQLIDCSEDYFIEIVLIFMHRLTDFYANKEDALEFRSTIQELIEKSKALLLQRHIPSIDRFIDLAKFAASIKSDGKLHALISDFISSVPPGIPDYSKQPPRKRLRYLNTQLAKNESYYEKLRSNYLASKIPTLINKETINEVTIERKILNLPYLKVTGTAYLENYFFIHITLLFIEALHKYLLQNQTINSITRQQIKHIINKANKLLYNKDQSESQKFEKLISSVTKKLKNQSEKLDQIISGYANSAEQKIGLNYQQTLEGSKCNRFIEITLSNIHFSEDYFIQQALFLIDKLTYFYVVDDPASETKKIIKSLLEKTKELLIQRETPAIDRMLQLANFMAQHDHQTDKLHEIISSYISYIPPSITNYSSQPPNKRQSYLESQFNQHRQIYQNLSRNNLPSQMSTFKDTSQAGQISIEETIAKLPYIDLINKTCFVDTREDYFIEATLKFINELCDYVIRNPKAGILHDRQHEIYLILKKANELIFQRDRAGSLRFRELAAFAIHRDTREKGELHQIIRGYVAKEPALGEYGVNEIPVNNRKQFITTKLLANADYYQNRDYSPSKLKNSDLNIPKFVLEHLVKNHTEETPIFWKLINWLSSIFNRPTLLLKKAAIHQNPDNVDDPHPPSSLVF